MSSLQDEYNEKCGEVIITFNPQIKEEYERNMKDENFLRELERKKQQYYFEEMDYKKKHDSKDYYVPEENEINRLKRLRKFKDGYDKGEFVTLSAAVAFSKKNFANGLTYKTCKEYAKELKLCIFDDKQKEWLFQEGTISNKIEENFS